MTAQRYTGTDNLETMKEAVNYNRFLAALVTRETRPGERLLDFGAGVGTFAQALSAQGHNVECVEPDPAQRAVIEAHGLRAHPSLDAIDEASVDVAYSLNVLEHIEDDRAAIHALADKLRIGGRLVVYVPAFQALYTSMDRKVGHLRRYRRNDLRAKVAAAGLNVLRAEYVDSLGFLATLAYRMLGSDTGDIDRNALRTYDRYVFPLSRAADGVLRYVLGKNALVIARRDA